MGELIVGVPHRGPSVVTLPFDLAATSPTLRDAGVSLRVVEGSYGELSSWLASGRIHLCRRGPDVDVAAAARGAPIASCASVMQAAPAQVVVQGDITEPDQLQGRKVGVIDPAMGSTLALRAWLRKQGVDVQRVTFEVSGATRQRLDALASGAIAATVVTAPSFLGLPARFRSMASLDEALGPFLFSAVQVHKPSAGERGQDIAAYLSAVMEAMDHLATGGDIVTDVAEVLQVGPTVAEAVLDRARRMSWYPPRMGFDDAATDAMIDALRWEGHVASDLRHDAWIWDDLRLEAVRRFEGG